MARTVRLPKLIVAFQIQPVDTYLRNVILSISVFTMCDAEVLNDFRPSAITSEYGAVSQVEFSTGLIGLEPQILAAHMPQAMRNFSFAESVWIIAYRTEIVDANGRPPVENYLCHTFFGDQHVSQREDQEMRGLYTDAFTPDVRLPEGLGVRVVAGDSIHWMPMFNNRGDAMARVRMKVRLSVIREKDLKKPVTQLYATLRSVSMPHLYFVQPGNDTRQTTFKLDFEGKIHFLGTHIHPYGSEVELFNLSRNELVWRGARKGKAGHVSEMGVYSDVKGYEVRPGEMFRVKVEYQNPTKGPIDAMGGLYVLYSRK